jgi:hypothetical protein
MMLTDTRVTTAQAAIALHHAIDLIMLERMAPIG